MDAHAVERLAGMHHRELAVLAQTDDVARRARRAGRAEALAAGVTVRSWRVSVGRGLVAAGLRLGLPPRRRHRAAQYAHALLAPEELMSGRRPPAAAHGRPGFGMPAATTLVRQRPKKRRPEGD